MSLILPIPAPLSFASSIFPLLSLIFLTVPNLTPDEETSDLAAKPVEADIVKDSVLHARTVFEKAYIALKSQGMDGSAQHQVILHLASSATILRQGAVMC
jgi:uncharacterized protein YaaW (UPF0174 family)